LKLDLVLGELHAAKKAEDKISAVCTKFKAKANETEDQRQQRLDNAAIKIQASHRGKMGRKRAEVVERLGLVGLQQLKEQKRQDLLAAQIAEEEAMQARASNRAAQAKALRLSEHLCWKRLDYLINRLVLPDNIEGLMERIVEVRAAAWARRFAEM